MKILGETTDLKKKTINNFCTIKCFYFFYYLTLITYEIYF